MLDDIPGNSAAVAKHLGLSKSTIERYKAAKQAPRPVMLALFWETRWGRSAADCEAANAAQVAQGYAASLERENAALRKQITIMEALLSKSVTNAANAPFFTPGQWRPMAQRRG